MKLEIRHMTRYLYAEPVKDSVNEVRLTPRTNYRQSCYHHQLVVAPGSPLFTYEDFFGNRVHAFTVNRPHKLLEIEAKAVVVTQERTSELSGLPYDEEVKLLSSEYFQNRYIEYLLPTEYTMMTDGVKAYAAKVPEGHEGMLDWTRRLSASIHSDFTYDPEATDVHTTVEDSLRLRRGVCQDYAHLMIAVCRSKGIPARYVSGYHFVGDLQAESTRFEQASHAWVEAHIPGTGWLGFDPTNNTEVDWRYVKLAHGRDYRDIVPVKGIFYGSGGSSLEVEVDVRLLEGDVPKV